MKKKNLGTKNSKKFIAVIQAVILSTVLYGGLVTLWVFSISYYPKKDFDSTEWSVNVEGRYQMSKDIIESKILIGKTHEEVFQILGSDFSSQSDSHLTYELGYEPGLFNIDPDYLEIRFKKGVVVSVNQNGR